jgi:hypothetical protein
VIVFTVPGAEIDRRRRLPAFLAAQARKQFPKTHIAAFPYHEAHRIEHHAPTAMQFELALRPSRTGDAPGGRAAGAWGQATVRTNKEQEINGGAAPSGAI